MNDQFLIDQVLAGNTNAFRFLVLRYQRPIFKFLHTFKLENHVIEDLAQEVFLRAYSSLKDYDSQRASFASWLFVIAKHMAINLCAKSKHAAVYKSYIQNSSSDSDARRSAEDDLVAEAEKHNLKQALTKIPDPFRSAVVLSYLDELSLEEVAKIEGCTTGTIKSRIFRGKKLLKDLLQPSGA